MEDGSSDAELSACLLMLEKRLMDPVLRRDREAVAQLLAEDFIEFGSSGRAWTRSEILDLLATETDYSIPEVEDFHSKRLNPGAVLVTYRTVRAGSVILRSSLWVNRCDQWQCLFHQGTLAKVV